MSTDEVSRIPTFRTTTTIPKEREHCIRGAPLAVILDCFGRRLRQTAGGIGQVAHDGDDTYELSEQTDQLAFFLSHSWHASWRAKYLALLFYFNCVPASVACALVGTLVTAWRWEYGQELRQHGLYCITVSSFFFVLLTWHKFPSVWGHRPPLFFFDKVCIHQTDPVQKYDGIMSIGGFLRRSEVLLVAWDATYFSRLWCTYELSAYCHARPLGPVVFVPISFGNLYVALIIMIVLAQGLKQLLVTWQIDEELKMELTHFFWISSSLVAAVFIRQHVHDVRCMDEQLRTFTVRDASCSCCSNNHKNPTAQGPSTLPCDRQVVYASIAHWQRMTFDVERGLEMFDKMIRGPFRDTVMQTLRQRCAIPYTGAVAMGILETFSRLGGSEDHGTWGSILLFVDWTLFRFPINIALVSWLTHECPWNPKSFVGKRALEFLLTVFWALMAFVSRRLSEWTSAEVWSVLLYLVCKIALLCYLYSMGSPLSMQWRGRHKKFDRRPRGADANTETELVPV